MLNMNSNLLAYLKIYEAQIEYFCPSEIIKDDRE